MVVMARLIICLGLIASRVYADASTNIVSHSQVLATVIKNAEQLAIYIEIFPNPTYKPDEGNASLAGTTAWAANQLTQGGMIFVHAGTYSVATPITISNAGITLQCADPGSTIFQAASSFNSTMFKIGWAGAQRQGMVVRDCGFNGNNGSQSSGTILDVRDTANALIEHNYIRFAKQHGLVLESTQPSSIVTNHIVGNDIFECGGACLEILDNGGTTSDNIVDRNTIGGSVIGDHISPWVYITGADGLQFKNNHISGTDHKEGMLFSASGQADILVADNVIENTGGTGIYFNGYQSQIVENDFYNVGTWLPNSYDMIDLDDCDGMLISNNKVTGYDTTRDGVRLFNGTSNSLVVGNVFRQLSGAGVNIVGSSAANNTIAANQYTKVSVAIDDSGAGTITALLK